MINFDLREQFHKMIPSGSQPLVPLEPHLPMGEIHIWCALLDRPKNSSNRLIKMLSRDERARAERFYFERDTSRFIARRGILRTILGTYLDVEPHRLQFCYGKNGKPALANEFANGKICFNLSHSEGIVLYAFNQGYDIGVDIERIRNISEMDQIAQRFFSNTENEILRSVPDKDKEKAFFNCWTRKEAFVKATGDGLSLPSDKFSVSLTPGEPARLLGIEGNSITPSRWSIQDLKPASGCAAALAVQGQPYHLKHWRWQYQGLLLGKPESSLKEVM